MNIIDFFTPDVIAARWTETASNKIPYLGAGLFPAKKRAGLDLKWLKGSKGLPVMLKPSAFDAKAIFRDRIGFEKIETEMPFFREGFKIKERDRQELLRVQDSSDPYARATIDRVFDDAGELIDGANVVPERMIMSLLFPEGGEAKIDISANGVKYAYDYDPEGAWKSKNYFGLTTTKLWSATATADPFEDIQKAQNAVAAATGAKLTAAIMNNTTFNMLAKIDAVKNRFLTATGKSYSYLTRADVANVFRDMVGVDFVVYDKMFKDENGVSKSFVPDGYVCLIPDGNLGYTWYGTTPEEADLMGSGKAEVSIVNTGVAVTRIIEEHPVNINTIASEIVLPSFERMDEIAVLKVIA